MVHTEVEGAAAMEVEADKLEWRRTEASSLGLWLSSLKLRPCFFPGGAHIQSGLCPKHFNYGDKAHSFTPLRNWGN